MSTHAGRRWSTAEVEMLRRLYPALDQTLADISQQIGRPAGAVQAKALALCLRRPRQCIREGSLSHTVMHAARASGAAGITTRVIHERHGTQIEIVLNICHRLHKMGLIHKAKVGARSVRWFGSAEAARQWQEDAHRPMRTAPTPRPADVRHRQVRAPWGPDEPAIITDRTKITICPGPPERPLRTNTYSNWG